MRSRGWPRPSEPRHGPAPPAPVPAGSPPRPRCLRATIWGSRARATLTRGGRYARVEGGMASHEELGNVGDYDGLHEGAGQDQNDGGDIDPTEVGHPAPDRAQERLGESVNRLPYGAHERVVGIDDVESHEPAHHRPGDDDVNIERDQGTDEAEQLEHRCTLRTERASCVMLPAPTDKRRGTARPPCTTSCTT